MICELEEVCREQVEILDSHLRVSRRQDKEYNSNRLEDDPRSDTMRKHRLQDNTSDTKNESSVFR